MLAYSLRFLCGLFLCNFELFKPSAGIWKASNFHPLSDDHDADALLSSQSALISDHRNSTSSFSATEVMICSKLGSCPWWMCRRNSYSIATNISNVVLFTRVRPPRSMSCDQSCESLWSSSPSSSKSRMHSWISFNECVDFKSFFFRARGM